MLKGLILFEPKLVMMIRIVLNEWGRVSLGRPLVLCIRLKQKCIFEELHMKNMEMKQGKIT